LTKDDRRLSASLWKEKGERSRGRGRTRTLEHLSSLKLVAVSSSDHGDASGFELSPDDTFVDESVLLRSSEGDLDDSLVSTEEVERVLVAASSSGVDR
jgi:hypothetical protein